MIIDDNVPAGVKGDVVRVEKGIRAGDVDVLAGSERKGGALGCFDDGRKHSSAGSNSAGARIERDTACNLDVGGQSCGYDREILIVTFDLEA